MSDKCINTSTLIKDFNKISRPNIPRLYDELQKDYLLGILMRISQYISYDDNILRANAYDKDSYFSVRSLGEALGVPYSTFKRYMTVFRNKDILRAVKNTNGRIAYIVMNPYIFSKGTRILGKTVELFENSIWVKQDEDFNMYNELRKEITQWRDKSIEYCGGKCVITGADYNDVHHIYPYINIVNEAISGIKNKNDREFYNKNKKTIVRNVLMTHKKYGLGACLDSRVHKLFHQTYSETQFKPLDFIEFIDDMRRGEHDSELRQFGLSVNINEDYYNYLKKKYM